MVTFKHVLFFFFNCLFLIIEKKREHTYSQTNHKKPNKIKQHSSSYYRSTCQAVLEVNELEAGKMDKQKDLRDFDKD